MPKKVKKEEKEEYKNDYDYIRHEVEDTGKDVDKIREEVTDAGRDIDEIKEEVVDTGKDIDEIKEDLEELSKQQKSLLKRVSKQIIPKKFNFNDVAQQIVGAIILSSPLAVTEEVWNLALELDAGRVLTIIGITVLFDVLLIYFTDYNKNKDSKIGNLIPARIVSTITISYLTAATMLYVFGVIGGYVTDLEWALKLVIFVGLFANVGAGTADLIK